MDKLWDGPVELFFWGGRLSIRDAKKKTVFYMDLDTREYWTVKKLTEKIGPLIRDLMNEYQDAPILINNAPNLLEPVLYGETPKRRGRPPKHG